MRTEWISGVIRGMTKKTNFDTPGSFPLAQIDSLDCLLTRADMEIKTWNQVKVFAKKGSLKEPQNRKQGRKGGVCVRVYLK